MLEHTARSLTALPAETPVTIPVASTVATPVLPEFQLKAAGATRTISPAALRAATVNCSVWPMGNCLGSS